MTGTIPRITSQTPSWKAGHDGWRWRTLLGSLIVSSACGLYYAFALYSQDLKNKAGLTQEELDFAVAMAQVGGNVGVHLGVMYDYLGPQATLAAGAAIGTPAWIVL